MNVDQTFMPSVQLPTTIAAQCQVDMSSESSDWTTVPPVGSDWHDVVVSKSTVTIANYTSNDCGFVEIKWELRDFLHEHVLATATLDTSLTAHHTRRTWWNINWDSRNTPADDVPVFWSITVNQFLHYRVDYVMD